MNEPITVEDIVITEDVGNINTKIIFDEGVPGSISYVPVVIPSAYTTYSRGASEIPTPSEVIRFAGDPQSYVFGNRIELLGDPNGIESYNDESRYWSVWYLRMVLYGMYLAMSVQNYSPEPRTPRLVLSIPAQIYGDENKLAAVKKSLAGRHVIYSLQFDASKSVYTGKELKHTYVIQFGKGGNASIRPEGAGSYARHLIVERLYQARGYMAPDGKKPVTNFEKENAAVAAWGWGTLSVLFFIKGKPSDVMRSNSKVGNQQIARKILPFIGSPMGFSALTINEIIQGNHVNVIGKDYDIEKVRKKLALELADQGISWIAREISNLGLNVNSLLLTGGTTRYLFGPDQASALVKFEELRSYSALPKIVVSYDSPMDDAIGLYLNENSERY